MGLLGTTACGDPRSEAWKHHREEDTGVRRAAELLSCLQERGRSLEEAGPGSQHTERTAGASPPRAPPSPQVEPASTHLWRHRGPRRPCSHVGLGQGEKEERRPGDPAG